MARARKRKASSKNAFDFEAVGLVLGAIGLFLLAILIPQFSTGNWGEGIRQALTGRIGLGAYFLPWPFLIYGTVLFIGRMPKFILRRSTGYFVFMFGIWSTLMLARPELSGSWGQTLRKPLTGFAGWLSFIAAFFVLSLGIDLFMRWPLGFSARGFVAKLVQGSREATRRMMLARQEWRDRAAFYADVALIKQDLRELDTDLKALNELFPNHEDVARWRKAIAAQLRGLKKPQGKNLNDIALQIDGWQNAVDGFRKVQAQELERRVHAEGIADFHGRIDILNEGLEAPFVANLEMSKPLEEIRQSLMLSKVALEERYHDLCLKRDKSSAEMMGRSPRALVQEKKAHFKRLDDYGKLIETLKERTNEVKLLAPWLPFSLRLEALMNEFPVSEELKEIDQQANKELRKLGKNALLDYSSWEKTLNSAERSTRAGIPRGINLEDEWQDGSAFSPQETEPEFKLLLDDPVTMPETQPEMFQRPLPPLHNHQHLQQDLEQLRLFPYALDKDQFDPSKTPQETSEIGGIPIQLPTFDLLDEWEQTHEDPTILAQEVQSRVRKIDETLANFRLEGRVVSSVRGPAVTRFEVEPAPGEKISRFANLSDDLALAMAVGGVRIEAPIPGKSVIGLEVPNANRDLIRFREAAASPEFRKSKARLPIILGKSIDGEMKVGDLARMPHMLIAGSTGSGKSVAVNTIIASLLYKFLPTELRFLMVDPKMVELTPYDGIPHMLQPVVTNPNDAAGVLLGAVAHMERRYKMMSKIGAKTIDQYNEKAKNMDLPPMPIIIIVIDELADLMITSPKEVESAIMRLAQMARATGMHLILATQRPSVDILTSLIKVNVPARMAFAVSSGHDSRTILDTMGAERLIGSGDMLYNQPGMVKPMRLQGPFITESELVNVAAFLRRQFFEDDFVEAYGSDFEPPSLDDSDATGFVDWNDDKLRAAAEIVIAEGQASVSRLQRRLQVGHARAGKLIDSLEALNVVGPHQGSKPREVLVEYEQLPDIFGS
ncbi:MAG: hypothetical protein KC422_02005 [Trueperaceae bacterium]|nr:hypothetical protein [Trueperaceae bacterium]